MQDVIRNRCGERLGATYTAGGADDPRLAVVAHGVTSHKERPWMVGVCDGLAEAGIASIRFTFAGNPGSEGRFEDATPSKEVADLGSVIDAFPGREIVCVGHSMGAAVCLLRAASDDRVRALVSLAGMFDVAGFMRRVFGDLGLGESMLGKAHCPLGAALLDDARRLGRLEDAARRVRVPWLLVHGTADELVPLQDSIDACAAAGGRPELVELPGVDHRFAGHERQMADAVTAWVSRLASSRGRP